MDFCSLQVIEKWTMRFTLVCILIIYLSADTLYSQTRLDLNQIMQGEAFTGYSPENPYWSPDGRTLYFTWNPNRELLPSLYAWNPSEGNKKLSLEERRLTAPSNLEWDSHYHNAVYELQGDLFLYSTRTNKTIRLTTTVQRETNPKFGSEDAVITYEADGNIYSRHLTTGTISQYSDFRKGQEKKEPIPGNQDQYLIQDQVKKSTILANRKILENTQKALRDSLRLPEMPKTIYTGDQRVSGIRVDPSGRYITYRLITDAKTKPTAVTDFVTKSGYTETLPGRPKVGQDLDRQEFYCYDRLADTVLKPSLDSLPNIFKKPEYLKLYHTDTLPFNPLFTRPRELLYYGPYWSNQGLAILEIKAADNKDRWLVQYIPTENRFNVIDHQQDTAWIGGPGISGWTDVSGNCGWLEDGETVWFQSEISGYSHLYSIHVPSRKRKTLTSGKFEILDVTLSRDKRTFYFRANAEGPHEQHIYKVSSGGGPLLRISQIKGNHEFTLSPDEHRFAIRHSKSNQPWELYVMENKASAEMRQITQSTTPEFNAYPWRVPEIVHVPASDGASVPGRLYVPDPENANGAAVIFVHGAGYLQNVHHWWSSYFREYMFHNLLCDEGFTVLDLDYRASSGYGRDWRTAIYRHMGGRDLEDHIDGAKYLVDYHGINNKRIGIYGGSYGGFITLMALFKYPGVFACGAALRSVTDWAHYNHPYTANILNTPATDSLAYYQSSPIGYAEGLNDPLLILHGMADVNVQFQDVVRLSQRLIELGKEDWEMAVYPMEDHGFKEASSWVDEYRRIYQLFQTYLK